MERRQRLAIFLSGLICLSTISPSCATYLPDFGGDGRNGNKTIAGVVTEVATIPANFRQILVQNGSTWSVVSGQMLKSNTTTIGQGASGSLIVLKGFKGGERGDSYSDGFGLGYGPSGGGAMATNGGGGGGGCGGKGGNGANLFSATGQTGAKGGREIPFHVNMAGSSGAGGTSITSGTGTRGGDGGGRLTIMSRKSITIAAGASISAPGGNGENAPGPSVNCAGGGGGSGGVIVLASTVSVVNSGTISLNGGNGGNGSGTPGGGGGGGGGIALFFAPTITTGTIIATGGSVGTGGNTAGTAGSAGISVSVIGIPTDPLLSWVQTNIERLAHDPQAKRGRLVMRAVSLAIMAAGGDWRRVATLMGADGMSCEAIGDQVKLGDNVA